MKNSIKIIIAAAMVSIGSAPLMAQQSNMSSKAPKLGKYTAAPKGSKLVFSHSSVQLLPGKFENGEWLAGVEIVLAPGWKTYWRVPGDAGVPAEFIWKNSTNVKTAAVSWPAPKRYSDITGKSIGYKKHVIFPIRVKPAKPGQPAKLDLRLYYAVCSDICIPAQANLGLELPLNQSTTPALAKIKSFVAKVPRRDAADIKVEAAVLAMVDGKPVLNVTLKGDGIQDTADILVEGYEDAYFDAPRQIAKSENNAQFRLKIDGVKDISTIKGKKLTLTVLSGENRLVADVVVR